MKRLALAILLVVAGFSSHRAAGQTRDEFCKAFIEAKSSRSLESARGPGVFPQIGFFLRLTFAKGSILVPKKLSSTPRQSLESPSIQVLAVGADSVTPSAKAEYEEGMERVRKMRLVLRPLLDAIWREGDRTPEDCSSRLLASGFDFEAYQSDLAFLEERRKVGFQIENRKIEASLRKQAPRKVSMETSVNLGRIQQVLRTTRKSVVALVLHADEVGDLYDSDWNRVPRSTFSNLSPSLRTLIVYSCHPEAVAHRYDLRALPIEIVVPRSNSRFFSRWFGEATPAPFFETFLKKAVPGKRIRIEDAKTEGAEAEAKDCVLRIRLPDLIRGELGIFLNREFIGLLRPRGDGETEIDFDCSLLKDRNVVTLRNLNLFERIEVKSRGKGTVEVNGQVAEWVNFFADDGPYIGSKAVLPGTGR